MKKIIIGKLKESLTSVLPITVLVIIISFFIGVGKRDINNFLISSLFLIAGMSLFTLGSDSALLVIGKEIGTHITKRRSLTLIVIVCFIIGFMVTAAEPDLTVLAEQFDGLSNKYYLIISVAIGVGIFMVIAALRIIFQIKLSYLLIASYAVVFLLAYFVVPEFAPVALDSGGVTTGPITVPFILALGSGIAMARGDKGSEEDSFGLVGLCSVGPIIAVLIMGLFLGKTSIDTETAISSNISVILLKNIIDVGIALVPFCLFFVIYQLIFLKLPAPRVKRILIGIGFTYVGLVLFLTGANFGFMPIGRVFGEKLGSLSFNWILIPLGGLIGFFTVMAEPAVHVLNQQVEAITSGAISKRLMLFSLAIGVCFSVALAMVRIIFDITIWWFIVPGYLLALGLMFFVPKIFTSIAFDSGGVASGPMTSTFILSLAIGVGTAVDSSKILVNAFGIVAFVAMTPLIVIQLLGLIYQFKLRAQNKKEIITEEVDDEIITFKETARNSKKQQGDGKNA